MSNKKMIEVQNLQKKFGDNLVLKDISESVEQGQVICVIGPSGSGKSTFLRCLNVLERPTGGKVIFEGKDLTHISEKELDSLREKMGMVFQGFNLFPNMSVLENIKLAPMKVKNVDEVQAEKTAKELLAKVGLADKANQFPDSLSGGQKQRVAIARALAMDPEVMLFDDPTSTLDPEMVKEVLLVIQDLVERDMTIVIVTHEMNYSRDVATCVMFIDEGVVVEEGTPDEIFNHPKHDRTKLFLNKIDY